MVHAMKSLRSSTDMPRSRATGRKTDRLKLIRTPDVVESTTEEHAHPVLSSSELAEVSLFGVVCSFQRGETLVCAGERRFCSYVLLTGNVRILDVSQAQETVVMRYGSGQFTGDVDILTGLGSMVTIEAETDVLSFRLDATSLRELFVRRPALGERLWKAYQRRRTLLLQSRFRGLSVYGGKLDKVTHALLEMLSRNMVPHQWLDTSDKEHAAQLTTLGVSNPDAAVVARGTNLLFEAPTQAQLAAYIGLRREASDKHYDVVILGSGPAGLGAAVNAASEGLSTLVLDAQGPGGQAGSSSHIENYAGFPAGINGSELARLAYLQAVKFGAEFINPASVSLIESSGDRSYLLTTKEGDRVRAKTIIISTGVSYRLFSSRDHASFSGYGLYYRATIVEALRCKGEHVHVIGGGNSAGQAAMFLSQHTSGVTLVLRGSDIHKSMSAYLSARVRTNDKIEVRYDTEVDHVSGDDNISAVVLRHRDGHSSQESTSGLFVFIGGTPCTDFLPDGLLRDDKGFILTGAAVHEASKWKEERSPYLLETSFPGVFAAGDCRSGTVKRLASAVGDGTLAITCVHQYLSNISTSESARPHQNYGFPHIDCLGHSQRRVAEGSPNPC